jgi:hypothetical protein
MITTQTKRFPLFRLELDTPNLKPGVTSYFAATHREIPKNIFHSIDQHELFTLIFLLIRALVRVSNDSTTTCIENAREAHSVDETAGTGLFVLRSMR